MRIVFVHGYKASSQMNFWPWLKDELRKRGHEVIAPDLPNPAEPVAEDWLNMLADEVCPLNDQTILVGHSLGAATVLRFLDGAEARTIPKGVVLVAAPWMIRHEQLRSFFLNEFDYEVIMWKAKLFTAIHSKDDKIVPFDNAQKYQRVLHAKLIETENDGHFMGPEYQVILQAVLDIIEAELPYAPGKSLDDQYSNIQ